MKDQRKWGTMDPGREEKEAGFVVSDILQMKR